MQNRIRVEPRSTKWLSILIVLLHLLAAFSVFQINTQSVPVSELADRLIIPLLLCCLLVSLLWQWHRHCTKRSSRWIKAFGFDGVGWWLETRDELLFAQLQADSVVTEFIIVLHFRLMDDRHSVLARRRSLVLFNDSAEADSLRRLRVFLRLQPVNALSSDLNSDSAAAS